MRGKKKSLDDFFSKKKSTSQRDMCDLSLCTATTRKEVQPAPLCTWKRNPNAFQATPQLVGQHRLGAMSKSPSLRPNFLLMSVKEGNTLPLSETATPSLGGVTMGIGQLLYNREQGSQKGKCLDKEERTDIESTICSDTIINGSVTVTNEIENESVEVSMSGFEFTIDNKPSTVSSLGRKGTRMMKEAKLAEQKVKSEECKIAEQRRLLDMEHTDFQKLLREFRMEAERAEERRREEEAKLAERRRLLKEAYLTEQARLMEEEERLIEESRRAVEATKRTLEEARRADYDNPIEDQISRSLSNVNTLGVLSETTWEHEDESCEFEDEEEALGKKHWKEVEASNFQVRGKKYLADRRKVPSGPNLFRLMTVDMVEVSEPIMTGFCSHPKERVQKWLQQEKYDCEDSTMPEFVFCMNMVLPGPPYYHLVMYFAIDDLSALGLKGGSNDRHFSSPLERFLFGNSDEFRNNTLKFIPHVKEGSFLLKTAVGTKPFILGKYLDQRFIQGDRYLEVISDVGSSTTFQQLVKLTSNYSSKISGEMAFVLEASSQAYLPENILCSVELTTEDFDGKIRFVEEAE